MLKAFFSLQNRDPDTYLEAERPQFRSVPQEHAVPSNNQLGAVPGAQSHLRVDDPTARVAPGGGLGRIV